MNRDFACLAIETATSVCSVAAQSHGRVAVLSRHTPPPQSRNIYRMIEEVMGSVDASLDTLDCIALGCGPGGFTGVRIGAAVAQALAFGARLPVCVVSTLAILARGAQRRHGADVVGACIDARMGEAYFGLYAPDDAGQLWAQVADCLVDPATFTLPGDVAIFAAGNGWAVYPAFAARQARLAGIDAAALPSAEDLLALAEPMYERGQTVAARDALPNYVRDRVIQ